MRTRQVLADRLWGGARQRSVDEFLDLVDEIGHSPLGGGRGATRVADRGAVVGLADPLVLTDVRFRPSPSQGGWVTPYETNGVWSGDSLARLERLRGAKVEVRDTPDGQWHHALDLPLLPFGTWNLAALPEPAEVAAARLVDRDGAPLPASVVDVEWLVER
ncbi:hypothetical protein [Actinacidiphila paucisporea]|uniref:Uncharacterized protein n=1 Tax=Actinacidiphila paucisporea TaxID=310782 RepID=A0A1M7P540_9ACTN|nr:hypothetical protein [Actinacidiphila paucisporea]SHN11626.1 hypothetical protein SAMN05216499_12149 [Actinacidiphila paucisporea]